MKFITIDDPIIASRLHSVSSAEPLKDMEVWYERSKGFDFVRVPEIITQISHKYLVAAYVILQRLRPYHGTIRTSVAEILACMGQAVQKGNPATTNAGQVKEALNIFVKLGLIRNRDYSALTPKEEFVVQIGTIDECIQKLVELFGNKEDKEGLIQPTIYNGRYQAIFEADINKYQRFMKTQENKGPKTKMRFHTFLRLIAILRSSMTIKDKYKNTDDPQKTAHQIYSSQMATMKLSTLADNLQVNVEDAKRIFSELCYAQIFVGYLYEENPLSDTIYIHYRNWLRDREGWAAGHAEKVWKEHGLVNTSHLVLPTPVIKTKSRETFEPLVSYEEKIVYTN